MVRAAAADGEEIMARDKRGELPEPTVDEGIEGMTERDSDAYLAGPTHRNEIGNTKRAAAKATGTMGASTKIDPELRMDAVEGDRPRSGSPTALHGFKDNPTEGTGEFRSTRSNRDIAEEAVTTARKSPAGIPTRTAPGGDIGSLKTGAENGRGRG
jgi:hypothetical protein